MTASPNFEARIGGLDVSLFAVIHSQSDDGDKRSWLALQRVVRGRNGSYCYLEVGSFLGGSLQPHLLDPLCRRIHSIDNRPAEPPDLRGEGFRYEDNSTARMMANLRAIDPGQTAKIVCFETDAGDIDPALLQDAPDLCFIDGEHTERAVLSDFDFCTQVCSPRAIVYFHDDWVIYPALVQILRTLRQRGEPFRAFKLEGSTFAIALGTRDLPPDVYLRRTAVSALRFLLRTRVRGFLLRALPSPILRAVRFLRRFLRRLLPAGRGPQGPGRAARQGRGAA